MCVCVCGGRIKAIQGKGMGSIQLDENKCVCIVFIRMRWSQSHFSKWIMGKVHTPLVKGDLSEQPVL